MSPTTRKWLKYFFVFLAVLTGVLGVLTLTVWNRALSSDLYIEALDESSLYTETTNIIEDQVSYYLVQRGDELMEELTDQISTEEDKSKRTVKTLLVWTIGMVVENQTPTVVSKVSDRLNIEENIELISEAVISESLDWVRGDAPDPKVFSYIPSVEEVENFERGEIVSDSLSSIVYSALGFTELKVCDSDSKATEALKQIEAGEWLGIACANGAIEEAVTEKIAQILPIEAIEDFKADLEDSYAKYGLDTLFEGLYNIILSASKLEEGLKNFRTEIQAIRYTGLGIFLLSVLFTIAATLVSTHRTIKTFFKTYIAVGVTLLIWSLIYNYIIAERLLNEINFNSVKLDGDAISSAQSTLWVNSVKRAATYILEHLHDYTIDAAIVIIFAAGVPLIFIYVMQHGGVEVAEDLWDKITDTTRNLTGRIRS